MCPTFPHFFHHPYHHHSFSFSFPPRPVIFSSPLEFFIILTPFSSFLKHWHKESWVIEKRQLFLPPFSFFLFLSSLGKGESLSQFSFVHLFINLFSLSIRFYKLFRERRRGLGKVREKLFLRKREETEREGTEDMRLREKWTDRIAEVNFPHKLFFPLKTKRRDEEKDVDEATTLLGRELQPSLVSQKLLVLLPGSKECLCFSVPSYPHPFLPSGSSFLTLQVSCTKLHLTSSLLLLLEPRVSAS